MEIDIEERLVVARQNLAILQSQRDTASQEEARLNVLILKYTGVIEYLESLEAPAPPDDGHGEEEAVPGKESEKVT